VTANSDALDLEPNVFTKSSAAEIARSLKHSAEASDRRKSSAFGSAMSMLTLYINRAGRNLPPRRKQTLDAAKGKLRELFGRRG
jgi:predicted alpha/beta-fold hydrolase